MKIFKLPDLGEGLPDAEIREWHVREGDEVKLDQPMVSMETAKAVVDVPAPRTGKISKLYGKAGDVIQTGAPLVEFTDGEESAPSKRPDTGTVAGRLVVGEEVLVESALGIQPSTPNQTVKALPAVRMLAKKLNVDLTKVQASGANGQITQQDVEAHAKAGQQAKVPEGYTALRGVRKAMAQAMSEAHASVVPVTLSDQADISAWPEGTDITLRVIRAVQAACQGEPALNAWYEGKALALKLMSEINIGIALDSAEGLFVPVLKDVAQQSDASLREHINTFKQQAKDRSLPQEVLRGATISISNFGVFAGRYASPVVVPPMVAIIGIGKLFATPVLDKGELVNHRMMPISLTFDHRAATGGEAARFLSILLAELTKSK